MAKICKIWSKYAENLRKIFTVCEDYVPKISAIFDHIFAIFHAIFVFFGVKIDLLGPILDQNRPENAKNP